MTYNILLAEDNQDDIFLTKLALKDIVSLVFSF